MLLSTLGQSGVFAMFVIQLVATVVNVFVLAEETNGCLVDEIAGVAT